VTRRPVWCTLLLMAALVSPGCFVSTLQPVYVDETIVFDESLLGRWENHETEISVQVTRAQWRSYHLAYTDRFGTTRFTAHLARVGAARFLNLRPEDGLERQAFLISTNGFVQVEATPAGVRVREPDYAALLERVQAGTAATPAATDLKKNILLTASSAALRSWLEASLKDETFWAEWKTFTRSAR
jgi:hypothetical protein